MASDDKNNNDTQKGFAGLSSMVSDIDTEAIKKEAAKQNSNSNGNQAPPPPSVTNSEKPVQQRSEPYYQAPQKTPDGGNTKKWVLGLGALIAFIWIVAQSGNKTTTSSNSSPTTPSPSTAITEPVPVQPPPSGPTRPSEEIPPTGTANSLSISQIRYCIAEDIRLNAAKGAVDNYSKSDITQFNAMVSDYNSRCGKYRYKRGYLERAQSDIEPFRSVVEAEGRSRIATKSTSEPQEDNRQAPAKRVRSNQNSRSASPSLTPDYSNNLQDTNTSGNRENFNTCITGEYPALCNHNLLSTSEASLVANAERRANYRTCITGEYPALCNHNLLSASEASLVANAERRAR